ncbi:MAG: hypothetical protein IJZ68_06120 [Bacteroidaceae bacterium]|nr:hypothetical protein [Bacteroidaceae bacterium]
MNFITLKETTGWSLKRLADYFEVPYRTIQNWAAGVSQCPDYLMKLFVYKMQREGILVTQTPYFNTEAQLATRIKVRITGDINDYAAAFLAIYNNIKSNTELLKMYNDYADGVYVVCTKDATEEAERFLSQFGEIIKTEDVMVFNPEVSSFEYPEDMDFEFLTPEE